MGRKKREHKQHARVHTARRRQAPGSRDEPTAPSRYGNEAACGGPYAGNDPLSLRLTSEMED